MVKSGADGEQVIVTIRGEVVLRPGDSFGDDVRAELYACYKLTRNCAAALRWYTQHAEDGAPIPALRTVQEWSRFYAWPEMVEAEYQLEHGRLTYANERQSAVNYAIALQVERDILTGAFDDNPVVGALRGKMSEVAQRRHERKIQTQAPLPPQETKPAEELSRDEAEARAKQSMIQREKSG